MNNVIRCAECRYIKERHYEEEPYIKYTCENKYGLSKYAVKLTDYCSRAEIKPMPKLEVGWGLTSENNHEYIVMEQNHAFNVDLQRVDQIEWILAAEEIVCIYKVDEYGIRQVIWGSEDV